MTLSTEQIQKKVEGCSFYYRGLCQISKKECDWGTKESRCIGPQEA